MSRRRCPHLAFTGSKSEEETLEQFVESVQRKQ